MPMEYKNRKGDTYYLFAGKTKTGKPKFFVSRKPEAAGRPLEAVPEGYELHESPADGLVHVRKIRPTLILPMERAEAIETIRRVTERGQFYVEVEGDALIVYWPDTDADASSAALGMIFGRPTSELGSMRDWTIAHTHYTPLMRFELTDADQRLFHVERWCFLGRIDRWVHLAGPQQLTPLLEAFAPHLGKESFFELM
jgi:hypothetical protein